MHSSLYSAASSCFGGLANRESSRRLPAQSNLFCCQLRRKERTHVVGDGDGPNEGGEEDGPPHNPVRDGAGELEVLVDVLAHRRPPVDGRVELGLAGLGWVEAVRSAALEQTGCGWHAGGGGRRWRKSRAGGVGMSRVTPCRLARIPSAASRAARQVAATAVREQPNRLGDQGVRPPPTRLPQLTDALVGLPAKSSPAAQRSRTPASNMLPQRALTRTRSAVSAVPHGYPALPVYLRLSPAIVSAAC